jgi:hypothetical protein
LANNDFVVDEQKQLLPRHGYCAAVIGPKMAKFERAFKDKLRPSAGVE